MVYGGTYVTYMKYDQGALADYLSWYPEYKSEKSEKLCPTLVYHMDYWQFSSSRAVAGINGRVLHLLSMTQKVSRIWYHTAPPWVEPDTPSLTKPNLA